MFTSKADILLWCQCSQNEDVLRCYPVPFPRLRAWFAANGDGLAERSVENIISGHPLWTKGRLAPIEWVCEELKVEMFRVCPDGLVTDLFGRPILGFLRTAK
jgi:hypothetical protein